MNNELIFYQLFEKESSTYTYLIGDPLTKDAIIIDPVLEMVDRDLKLIEELGLKLKFILETHVHADHITGSGQIRKKTGAQVALSALYPTICPDIGLVDGQELRFGNKTVTVISTPGHTNGCLSYKIDNLIFTGDVLLIRGCGRTDFQSGSSNILFNSVRIKLFCLDDATVVYPAHDYKGFTKSTIGLEKKFNPRLNLSMTEDGFIKFMSELNLDFPKKIQEAVPSNLKCGLLENESIPLMNPENIFSRLNEFKIIDVRRPDEFSAELGHISHAILVTLGVDFEMKLKDLSKDEKIVFVCRSGMRSAESTKRALQAGFKNVFNLEGGMLKWNELKLPIVK